MANMQAPWFRLNPYGSRQPPMANMQAPWIDVLDWNTAAEPAAGDITDYLYFYKASQALKHRYCSLGNLLLKTTCQKSHSAL